MATMMRCKIGNLAGKLKISNFASDSECQNCQTNS